MRRARARSDVWLRANRRDGKGRRSITTIALMAGVLAQADNPTCYPIHFEGGGDF
jgi:hypothetical protein